MVKPPNSCMRVALACSALLCVLTVPRWARAADGHHPAAPHDWFHTFALDKDTYAISEPKYWQQNVSYLLLGTKRAILFDTGPGIYGIRAVVASITKLPLMVIPSHLHFDHVGNLQEFNGVYMLDSPALRSQAHDGKLTETSAQLMLTGTTAFRVSGWLADGQSVDLGNRVVTVVSTPGHTPDSVSLIDMTRRRMFTGDLVNRLVSLVDVPGSDVRQLSQSLQHLLALAPPDSAAYEAHAEIPLQPAELRELSRGIAKIADGKATPVAACLAGVPMKRYDVGPFPVLLPAEGGVTLRPLTSAEETLDWLSGTCGQSS